MPVRFDDIDELMKIICAYVTYENVPALLNELFNSTAAVNNKSLQETIRRLQLRWGTTP